MYIFFSLLSGIMIAYFSNFRLKTPIAIYMLIAIVAMLLAMKKHEKFFIIALFIILGGMLYNFSVNEESITSYVNLNNPIEVLIINDGIQKGSFKTYMEYETIVKITNERSLIRVYNSSSSLFEVGDIIRLYKYKVNPIDSSNEVIGSFYNIYKSRGIKNIIDVNMDNIYRVGAKTFGFRYFGNSLRRYVEYYFDQSFSNREGSLLKSIIFGNRGYMPPEMIAHFSKSGTAHIIAVSGLHIGLLIVFLDRILKLIKIRKTYIKIITVFILLLYSYAVNFPVSIVRASLMYYLYIAAFFLERKYDAINTMMLIAVILLILNPHIIFSVSFQLSFCATFGILVLYPLIYSRLEGFVHKSICGLLAVTLSAQIATLPILVFHFNYLSIISIVANLLIVPVIGALISITLISIILSLLPINIAIFLNFLINLLLKYILKIAEISSESLFSGITIEFIQLYHVIIYYVVIVLIYMLVKSRKQFGIYTWRINNEL
ncbi:competence protein ComEC [Serpentinicella alkaliphila]|uniref:Competence protein ComEC n=1 Tax=Serpentinicella alkaliphila TaxID=1734049 RepID=A0A4R2UD03_9FIRM|nr:competence protein ComEC [Serpentinicella alkaliphila]